MNPAVQNETAANSWFEGLSAYMGELVAVEASGFLRDRREANGLEPYPRAEDQQPVKVNNTGENLTQAAGSQQAGQLQPWMLYVGAALVILALLFATGVI